MDSYQVAQAAANNALQEDRPPSLTSSTLVRLDGLRDSLKLATASAHMLCDRLWGTVPEADADRAGLTPVRTGAHGALEDRLDSLDLIASELIGLTARLETGI